MAYSEAVLARATARLEQDRAEKERENAEHLQRAYAEYPRLRELDRQIRITASKAIAASFERSDQREAILADLREKSLQLQRERDWILEAGGFEDGFLDGAPVCERCGGRGYIGSSMCECLKELCRQEQRRELTSLLVTGHENFDNFRLDVYPDTFDPKLGTSPQKIMRGTLRACRKYCAEFTVHSPSLLFSGATGLGKTFLSACIARQVADRGFSVVYETAIQMLADFETARFGEKNEENQALPNKYFQTDLLLIDDLGMEMTTQFNTSTLYNILNTRLNAAMPTIISTNLSPEQLQSRYSPQIASRLLGMYSLYQFSGNDLRRRKL